MRNLYKLFLVAIAMLFFVAFAPKAQAQTLVVRDGAKCLDVEGGSRNPGARIVRWDCSGADNQKFYFVGDTIHAFAPNSNLCLDVKGGMGRQGDSVVIWACNGGANQRWRWNGHQLIGMNNMCMDVRGGVFVGNADVILYGCNGGRNQQFYKGTVLPASAAPARVRPGTQVDWSTISLNGARVVSAGGGNVVSPGGGNVVAAGGGNVIAAGGGNVIAAGGGNVIAVDIR